MYKFLLLMAITAIFACNNSTTSKNNSTGQTGTPKGLPKDSLAREETFNFIDGCMDNAKLTLGNEKAFAFCKCIYDQIKSQNPGADSLVIEELASDTARVAKMAANCR